MEMAQVSIPFSKKEGDVLQMKPPKRDKENYKGFAPSVSRAELSIP
jgi:hypothetical protein